jgi:hypothetical protein
MREAATRAPCAARCRAHAADCCPHRLEFLEMSHSGMRVNSARERHRNRTTVPLTLMTRDRRTSRPSHVIGDLPTTATRNCGSRFNFARPNRANCDLAAFALRNAMLLGGLESSPSLKLRSCGEADERCAQRRNCRRPKAAALMPVLCRHSGMSRHWPRRPRLAHPSALTRMVSWKWLSSPSASRRRRLRRR